MIAALLVLLAASDAGTPRTTEGVAQEKHELPGERKGSGCDALPSEDDLRKLLQAAPAEGEVGGFGGKNEWAAIVNREGEVCAVVVSTDDPSAAWPGSQ